MSWTLQKPVVYRTKDLFFTSGQQWKAFSAVNKEKIKGKAFSLLTMAWRLFILFGECIWPTRRHALGAYQIITTQKLTNLMPSPYCFLKPSALLHCTLKLLQKSLSVGTGTEAIQTGGPLSLCPTGSANCQQTRRRAAFAMHWEAGCVFQIRCVSLRINFSCLPKRRGKLQQRDWCSEDLPWVVTAGRAGGFALSHTNWKSWENVTLFIEKADEYFCEIFYSSLCYLGLPDRRCLQEKAAWQQNGGGGVCNVIKPKPHVQCTKHSLLHFLSSPF